MAPIPVKYSLTGSQVILASQENASQAINEAFTLFTGPEPAFGVTKSSVQTGRKAMGFGENASFFFRIRHDKGLNRIGFKTKEVGNQIVLLAFGGSR